MVAPRSRIKSTVPLLGRRVDFIYRDFRNPRVAAEYHRAKPLAVVHKNLQPRQKFRDCAPLLAKLLSTLGDNALTNSFVRPPVLPAKPAF